MSHTREGMRGVGVNPVPVLTRDAQALRAWLWGSGWLGVVAVLPRHWPWLAGETKRGATCTHVVTMAMVTVMTMVKVADYYAASPTG